MKLLLALAVFSLLLAAVPSRADAPPPQISLPLLKNPPTIDGTIAEAEWAGAVRNVGLCNQYDLELEAREAIFWVGADANNLYIAMKSELPPSGDLLTRAVPDGDRDVVAACSDDSVELVIHPHLGATTGDQRYFHIICNAREAMYDRALDLSNAQNPVNMAWRLKGWTFKQSLADGWWNVEIAIPFAAIGATPADLQHQWGLRVCRNWQRGWDQSRWEAAHSAYEDLPTMPRVSFDPLAPVVQVLGLRGEKAPQIELAVSNPGAAAIPVKAFLSDVWSRNPATELRQDLNVAPGATEKIVFTPPHGGVEGAHHTVLQLTSPDEKRVFYLRDFTWHLDRPAERWTLSREDKQAIQLQYAIYPYYRKLKARVSIDSLATKDKVTGAELALLREGADKPLVAKKVVFKDYVAEAVLDTPELAAGKYEIRAKLQGPEGVPTDPVTQLCERKVFPWEHNKLGLSDRVIPPFTPIQAKGNVISTVLRQHTVGKGGVWDQVVSLDRPLLKAPMRWVATADGKSVVVTGGSLKLDSAKATQAVTTGSFTAGAVRGTVRSEWDYDGMAKLTVTLPAAAGKSLDRLSLEIPLDDAQMPYMHACGDGLRYNFAGFTPKGDGPIWDSTQANRTALVGTFYPYIWLGGGERGLAWFADSDKGWSLDDKTPTVQLERQGGTLLLRVNFITKPTALDKPREIVFGLQATPVKPMPEAPVNWRRWINHYWEQPKVQPFTIIGASYYYGCVSYDLYPINRDYSIYRAFSQARDTGKPDPEFTKQYMEQFKQYFQPGSEDWKSHEVHISSGMNSAAGLKRTEGWLWTPYTNIRGASYAMEEWPVFQDEWHNFAYFQRTARSEAAYEVTPTASFRDAAAWYYKEMMTCFDGVYWDNIFLAANNDTVAAGAWTDEQGRIHPSMGLWDLREMFKRTAVLFNEQGRPVFNNVAHMTNTNLVPVLAFCNVNLDWEWQYGKRDWQDRFTPDLAVAETIGRQTGNVPLVLAGGFYDPKDPAYDFCMRTRMAVCLVHEIRFWDWGPAWCFDLYKKLFDFGYGDPACQVYNYWAEGFPLTVAGCDAKGIVMVNGKRAVVAVTDYSGGGDVTLKLDLKAVGLPDTVKATDFETGAALTGAAPGEVSFPLKKHDLKVVLFE